MNAASNDRESPSFCARCSRPVAGESRDGICETCREGLAQTRDYEAAAPFAATTTWPDAGGPDRYERLELLGHGGMGEVYRARQRDLDRIVALKLVLTERSQDPQFVARFRREALAMGRLNHPHIVAIHDFGQLEGRPFLAMEFVRGESLRARLRHGAIPSQEAFELAAQLCEAIAYAHGLGIVHRDLKPENILVTDQGQVKVADFGLAKLMDQIQYADLTAEGAVLGTLRYMAPEQLAGTRDVDERADVYSLGVVLYEMFTGKIPIGRFALPSRIADVSPSLDAVLLKALDAEPAHRFPSARELAAALAMARRSDGAGAPTAIPDLSESPGVGNLPQLMTSLLGREDERQLLRARLAAHRLVTLTGPGGTGKSRLAIQTGFDLSGDYTDGVWLVALGELSDPRRVPAALAAALGVREDSRDILDAVRTHLAQRAALLILDNFEQLAAAAPVIGQLLDAAPRIRILVTSRAALRVSGEQEFPLGPLPLPRIDNTSAPSVAATSPAVALFVERAQAVRPDFQLTSQNVAAVVEICRRLDGLPLAIELAAARVKLLTPESLVSRLSSSLKVLTGGARDLPARQQTMRAAIAWSYDLLTPPQRTLLAWLIALRGSFTVESAEQLVTRLVARRDLPHPPTGEPLDEAEVLDALTALVDHHLLRRAAIDPAPRFAMYETIREFGEEQLRLAGDLAGLWHGHAEWCLDVVTRGEPALTGSNPGRILAEWDCELPDFRAALSWWRGAGGRPDDALRIIGELWYYWILRGSASEGIEQTAATIDHPQATRDTPAYSRALHALGTLYFLRDRPKEARAALERALEIRRRLEPEDKFYATLGNLASVKRSTSDLAGALRDLQDVLAYRRRQNDSRATAVALSNLSLLHQFMGRLDDAQTTIHESLEIYSSLGDRRGQSRQFLNLGRLEHSRGRYGEALRAFEAARDIAHDIGDSSGKLNTQLAIANTLTALGQLEEARRAFADCADAMTPDEPASRLASFHIARGYLERRLGDAERALADYRDCLRLRLEHDDSYGVGEVLVEFAAVYSAQSRFIEAARLLGAEARLREQVHYEHSDDTMADIDRTRQAILAGLGATALRAAEDEGRQWPLEKVAATVLDARWRR